MAKIDDVLGQADEQNPKEDSLVSKTTMLNVTSVLLGLLQNSHAAPVAALLALSGFATAFHSKQRDQARAEALLDGLRASLGDLVDQVDVLEKRPFGPDAEDAIVKALQNASNSARLDKARRFGQIIGGTLRQESPNWQEASEFIRDIEQFTDADIVALKILWKVQRKSFDGDANERRTMSTDANSFTSTWKDALAEAAKNGVSRDDWDARCGRLAGFGLASQVQPNASHQGPDAICFRLTGRGVRLLELLVGKRLFPREYPKVLYHPTLGNRTVEDEDHEQQLGEGWFDIPAKFPQST